MRASTSTLEDLQNVNFLYEQEVKHLRNENLYLKEQVEWFKRQLFGHRSEKIISNLDEKQLTFEGFDPPEKEQEQKATSSPKKSSSKKKEDRVSLPANLPVETQILDISEEEKVCKITGQLLVKIGEEVSHKLAYKPGSYFIKQIIRPKYAFPQNSEGGIVTALLPDSLLTRCQADESFLVSVKDSHLGVDT